MAAKWTAAHWGTYRIQSGTNGPILAPDPDDPHPSRIGGGWMDAMQNTNTRILRPSIRKDWLNERDRNRHGDATFVELPWDEAIDILGKELDRVIETHGNKSIFAGSYGWASAGRFHHAQSQLRRFLNTIGGYTGSANTYSHAGAEVLLPHITGLTKPAFQDQMTSWPLIANHCETLVAFGGISNRPAQIDSAGTSRHETKDWLEKLAVSGCKMFNISPKGDDMADSTQWIAPRPGTDTALILSLAYEIYRNGFADQAFLDRYTSGADVFEAYVTGASDGIPKTPDWAAQICDIPSHMIRDLARRMATTKTMITMAWGIQRADHGELTLWAGLALACVLGQIGGQGTGFGFGYGSTEPVGRARKLISWPSLPQGQNPVIDFIPVARVADMLERPGSNYTYNGQIRTYPDAKLIWWSGGNPFHHHQNLMRLDQLWRKPETVVVMDHSWTATARRADVVLPATSPLERDDLMINRRDTALIYMSAAKPAEGEARNDYDILSGLAERMGTHTEFTQGRSAEDWQRDIWAGCQTRAATDGFTLPDFDDLRRQGRFDVPDTNETRILFADFIADPNANPLQTHSGKIEIYSPTIEAMIIPDLPPFPQWIPPVAWLGDAQPDQLHLISGQPDTRLHGQNDSGRVSLASKIQGREPCCLHPATADHYGLTAGDIALIANDQGACLAGVTMSDQIRPDCVWLATGAWLDVRDIDGLMICVHGNPNVLTIDKGSTGLSQGNIAHTALVRVSKWEGSPPDLIVHKQPHFDSA
jgi:biotin/methionine sulfoxide reductase